MFNIFSCFSPKADKNCVHIRIENQTTIPFTGIQVGTRVQPKNGYKTFDCITEYSSLNPGETSSYKETRGEYLGYNRIQLEGEGDVFSFGRLIIDNTLNPNFGREFATYSTEKQELNTKVDGRNFQGLGFPKGKYTYLVVLDEKGKPIIKISKE